MGQRSQLLFTLPITVPDGGHLLGGTLPIATMGKRSCVTGDFHLPGLAFPTDKRQAGIGMGTPQGIVLRPVFKFVITNPDHELAGSAQYWYAETFRIRQLYTDAASAYLEGYQKYPKSKKAPINLLKLGVSLVQIGEKDQGCLMITGVQKQYPKANQSVLQKAKYEEKKFECKKENS